MSELYVYNIKAENNPPELLVSVRCCLCGHLNELRVKVTPDQTEGKGKDSCRWCQAVLTFDWKRIPEK